MYFIAKHESGVYMNRFINVNLVIAAQMTTPAENPLVTDTSRMMDVWFGGSAVRKQLFRKVTKGEQEFMVETLKGRGFIQSGNLLVDPAFVMFAEMENQFLGGIITIGFGENGKPVELKLGGKAFNELCNRLSSPQGGGGALG
jgi:hypothetical protein